mgnify:CR=1 FL=1
MPLILVSLTGQFLPGMAILHGSGYPTPAKPILAVTSIASLIVYSTLGTLYIFYDLSRRLTLRGQTGEKSAVDIIYTVKYD